jgi:hypothetical protein
VVVVDADEDHDLNQMAINRRLVRNRNRGRSRLRTQETR